MKLTHDHYMLCNDYIDEVIRNPYDFSEEEIFFLGYFFKPMRKIIFDSLLMKCAKQGNTQDFIDSLTVEGIYAEYINDVKNSSNKFMKLIVAMFLETELLGEWFENEDEMLEAVIKSDAKLNTKLFAFSKLSVFNVEDETIEKMKEYAKKEIDKDEEFTKNFNKEEKEKLKKDCISNYDSNHDALKMELSLKE